MRAETCGILLPACHTKRLRMEAHHSHMYKLAKAVLFSKSTAACRCLYRKQLSGNEAGRCNSSASQPSATLTNRDRQASRL